MKSFYSYIILCFILSQVAYSQDSVATQNAPVPFEDSIPKVEMLANFNNSQILLRFALNKAEAWYANIPYGFKIERFQIDAITGIADRSTRDTFLVIPWPKEEFDTYANTPQKHKYLLTMAECMYGETSASEQNEQFASVAKEIRNKHGFALFAADMSFTAAEAGAMAFIDSFNIKEGQSYFYRVRALLPDSTVMPAYTSVIAKASPVPRPELAVCLEGEGKVTLQWERDIHEPHFSAFWIERSKDSINYERVNEIPFVGGQSQAFSSPYFSYTDRIPLYKPYYYRIRGITPFSELSPPSGAVRLMSRDRTPCNAASDLLITTDAITKEVKITWEQAACEDLRGWQVYKGSSPELPFKAVGSFINTGDGKNYQEIISNTRTNTYYKIQTVDTAGNASYTLARLAAFRDTLPPLTPKGLNGRIDSNGVVHLKWQANTEDDLRGYHLFKANAEDHIFTMINAHPIDEASYADTITLQTLTEEIYYRVSAVDFQGHISKYSAPLKLLKPDTIPPFPPGITHYGQEKGHVYIDWSPSRTKDLSKHTLYKKVNDGKWEKVKDLAVSTHRIIDKEVMTDSFYTYKILAVDDAGLMSDDHATIRLKFIDKRLPQAPAIVDCRLLDGKGIHLEWEGLPEEGSTIIVYRSINGGVMTVLDRIEREENIYVDKNIRKGHAYQYALKVKWPDGKRSPFSEIVHPENLKK